MSTDPVVAVERARLAALLAEVRAIEIRLQQIALELVAIGAEPQPKAEAEKSVAEALPALASAAPPAWSISRTPVVLKEALEIGRRALPTNGIDIRSGKYLLEIDAPAAARMAQKQRDTPKLTRLHSLKQRVATEKTLGLVGGYNEDKLEDSRWAVVVSAADDVAVLDALRPLIEHRAAQQGISLNPEHLRFERGETCAAWYYRLTTEEKHRKQWHSLPPVLVYRRDHGEDMAVNTWLARYGASQGPVDPARGVPFYLMLAARPGPLHAADEAFIPFGFQYELDMFWGVGRLCFSGFDGNHDYAAYRTYAERLVAFEQRSDAAERLRKEIVYFGTDHGPDDASSLSAAELVAPLYNWHTGNALSGAGRFGFGRRLFLGQGTAYAYEGASLQPDGKAERADIERVFTGNGDGRPPAIFFSAMHGAGMLDATADELLRYQGALICQDWQGVGNSPARDHRFAGEDLGNDAKVEGMISMLFACYGAGCPRDDEFVFEGDTRPQIAPFPFAAQLPQRLLLNGSLAVLGHVERAWTYAFQGLSEATAQSQGFEDVLSRIAAGKRLGFATDQFNTIQGARSATLAGTIENIRFGYQIDPYQLAQLWIARNDARNYALLGDPAVRLPFLTGQASGGAKPFVPEQAPTQGA